MEAVPRVAIDGGGLSGCIAALVLRSRGNVKPVILDAGRRSPGGRLLGGRHADSGVQFMRATEPKFAAIIHMLAKENLVAPWRGRFGLLGSQGGGFLPHDVLAGSPIGSMMKANENNEAGSVDFCGLLGGDADQYPVYVGTPSNSHILHGLCEAAGIEVVLGAKVTSAVCSENGKWTLDAGDQPPFDALLLATHDAALGAATVRSTILPSVTDDADATSRLSALADALQAQRDERTSAVFTWSGYFPCGFSEALPFDAATVPGSRIVHFLARDASKPGREPLVPVPSEDGAGAVGELWTAVSTPAFAKEMLAAESLKRGESGDSDKGGGTASAAADAMANEISSVLAHFFAEGGGAPPRPLHAAAKRWGAGFAAGTLGLKEDCVSLEPWRLAIAGDFLADRASPVEAAALSGMEAGERIAKWFPTSKL